MAAERAVLGSSVERLRGLVEPLAPADLRAHAYPSEWSIAQVLAHIGSGDTIATLWVNQALSGTDVDVQSVWDEWDAKDPDAAARDALLADRAFLERLDAVTDDERAGFRFEVGPISVDFAGFIRLRINEHVLHTWDVEVASNPAAGLQPDAVPIVFDAFPMICAYAAKPTGSNREIRVRTTTPESRFVITLSDDSVSIRRENGRADAATFEPDLTLPAEALVRLVYGRLDADHTPALDGAERDLDELRRAFPGV